MKKKDNRKLLIFLATLSILVWGLSIIYDFYNKKYITAYIDIFMTIALIIVVIVYYNKRKKIK